MRTVQQQFARTARTRNHADVPAGRRAVDAVEDRSAVRRPVLRRRLDGLLERRYSRLWREPARRLDHEFRGSAPPHSEHHARPVWRKDRVRLRRGIERKSRPHARIRIAEPQIYVPGMLRIRTADDDLRAIGRDRRAGVCRLADGRQRAARPVHPRQPRRPGARMVRERARRNRKRRRPIYRGHIDVRRGDRNRFARQREAINRERLEPQQAVADEEQVAGIRVPRRRRDLCDTPPLVGVERSHADLILLALRSLRDIHEVPPVGEEARILRRVAHAILRAIGQHQLRRAAGGSHTKEPAHVREEDDTVGAPHRRHSSEVRRVAHNLRRAVREIDALDLPVGEESDRTAIGRPERTRRPITARERPR